MGAQSNTWYLFTLLTLMRARTGIRFDFAE